MGRRGTETGEGKEVDLKKQYLQGSAMSSTQASSSMSAVSLDHPAGSSAGEGPRVTTYLTRYLTVAPLPPEPAPQL